MILAIENPGSNSSYFVVPEDFDVDVCFKEYNGWYKECYLPRSRVGHNSRFLTFPAWLLLVVKGVRTTRDEELTVFYDD